MYAVNSGSHDNHYRYECTASAVSGPIIYWRVYHKEQDLWENLGVWSGEGFEITQTNISTCVAKSVLVIDRTRRPGSDEGDIVSCTVRTGPANASLYVSQGT